MLRYRVPKAGEGSGPDRVAILNWHWSLLLNGARDTHVLPAIGFVAVHDAVYEQKEEICLRFCLEHGALT